MKGRDFEPQKWSRHAKFSSKIRDLPSWSGRHHEERCLGQAGHLEGEVVDGCEILQHLGWLKLVQDFSTIHRMSENFGKIKDQTHVMSDMNSMFSLCIAVILSILFSEDR